MKLLMVCLGNICRSPLAQGIMTQKIAVAGLDWEVDSAGTSSWHEGSLPDTRSIQTAKNHGLNIMHQRSRPFVSSDFDAFDKIFVMDSSNYQNVVKLANSKVQEDKVDLIMNLVQPNSNMNVPDPYWDNNGFENVYQMLDKACDKIIELFG